ncbi:MAG: BON domain-containing protein [Planctomycetota bacterium]
MRQFLTGLVVAAITLAPAWALAGNQEVADQIAKNLRTSGKLSDYKIGVKYQDGTAWLVGYVRSEEQKAAALKVAFATEGVNRVVNDLSIQQPAPVAAPAPMPQRQTILAVSAEEPAETPMLFAPQVVQPASASEAAPNELPRQAMRAPMPMQRAQPTQALAPQPMPQAVTGAPMPMYSAPQPMGVAPARYDNPHMPCYAWPSYAAYPNYAAVTYPKQYSPTAWPYIGPFYPYPQVPLGWRKVTLEWDDGWWMLDFKDTPSCHRSPIGRWY